MKKRTSSSATLPSYRPQIVKMGVKIAFPPPTSVPQTTSATADAWMRRSPSRWHRYAGKSRVRRLPGSSGCPRRDFIREAMTRSYASHRSVGETHVAIECPSICTRDRGSRRTRVRRNYLAFRARGVSYLGQSRAGISGESWRNSGDRRLGFAGWLLERRAADQWVILAAGLIES